MAIKSVFGAALAGAGFLLASAAAEAAVVTISGQVNSYYEYFYGYYYDDNDALVSWSSTRTHYKGGPVGETFKITIDLADDGSVNSWKSVGQLSLGVDDFGTFSPVDGFSAANLTGGSGGSYYRSLGIGLDGAGSFVSDDGNLNEDAGYEVYDRLTLAPLGSPIPEPTSWALMLIGVAGIGGAMRRRSYRGLSGTSVLKHTALVAGSAEIRVARYLRHALLVENPSVSGGAHTIESGAAMWKMSMHQIMCMAIVAPVSISYDV